MKPLPPASHFEGLYCTLQIEAPAPGVIVLTLTGTDIGELGDAPFQALLTMVAGERETELFVDARQVRGVSIDVSNDWAQWLNAHRERLLHASILTANRFVQVTAEFVQRFADLGEVMRIYTEPAVFEGALANALGNARRRSAQAASPGQGLSAKQ